jgi:signal transduction histidine kinase
VLYQSEPTLDTAYSAEVPLWNFMPDGPMVRLAIRPAAAEKLLNGGVPRSRVPLLTALLMLAGVLVLVALVLSQRAQELAELRADFTSSVSHELRTPLAQILLFAETLSLGRVRSDDERRDAADVIVQEARRLGQLVENVLHFSRAERRMATLSPETLQLAPFVQGIVHSWTPLAGACDVHVRTELDESAVAVVDRGALRQMLLNLLDNAAKYGPAGQTITVAVERNEHVVRVRVDDEGPGIPTDQRARVWEPFFRLPRDVASATAGSGIGLFVVRELALLQGGSVRLEQSAVGGARVVFELPAGANDGTRHSALDDGAEQRSASAECRVAPFTSVKA